MKTVIRIAIAIAVTSASLHASANDDFDRTIDRIGMQFNSPYVVFKEGLSTSCGFVSLGSFNDAQTRGMYAALLSARAGNNKVYHISYSQNSDGTCLATALELKS
jgi:hypothetical protein